jgi:Glycosyl transferase 4-like domain
MKIAIVVHHATPLHPRAGARPRPDDAGLSELTRILARQGHRVAVYAQKRQPDVPDRAELGGGLRVVHIPGGAAGKRGDAELLARLRAFSDPLRARWRRERPDVVHAVTLDQRAPRPDGYPRSWRPGCAGIQLAWRRGAAGPRQRGPGHAAASQARAGAGHGPAPTVFAAAVTKTARLLASKGPQSTYVRNS